MFTTDAVKNIHSLGCVKLEYLQITIFVYVRCVTILYLIIFGWHCVYVCITAGIFLNVPKIEQCKKIILSTMEVDMYICVEYVEYINNIQAGWWLICPTDTLAQAGLPVQIGTACHFLISFLSPGAVLQSHHGYLVLTILILIIFSCAE